VGQAKGSKGKKGKSHSRKAAEKVRKSSPGKIIVTQKREPVACF
jgi:hypothetical protein